MSAIIVNPLTGEALVENAKRGKSSKLSGGHWVTTESGNHLYIKGSRVAAGNPHVVAAATKGGTHSVKLPKNKRRLDIDTASSALQEMGYKLDSKSSVSTPKGTSYEVTHPDGKKVRTSADDIKKLVYSSQKK